MGNCLWRSLGDDDSDSDTPVEHYPQHSYGGHEDGDYSSRPDPIKVTVVGFEAFVRDLMEFETTNEVPKALSNYGCACGATQRLWFMKLLIAWKQANPTPTSAEAVAVFLIETLQCCSNFQDLLRFYQLSWPTVSAVQLVPMPMLVGELETKKLKAHAPAKKLKKRKQNAHVPVSELETRKLEAHAPAKKLKKRKQKAHVPVGELETRKLEAHAPAKKLKKRKQKAHVPVGELEPRKLKAHAPAKKLKKRKQKAHVPVGELETRKLKAHAPTKKLKKRKQKAHVPVGELETRKLKAHAPAKKLKKRKQKAHVPIGELETRKLEAHAPAKKLKKRKQKAHVPVGELETRKLEAHAPAKKLKKRKQKAHVPVGKLKKKKPQVHVPACKLKKRALKSQAPIGKLDSAKPKASGAWLMTPKATTKVQYEIHTLPVTWKEDEGDGDGFTVFVNVHTDARETKLLPKAVKDAALLIHKAQAQMNYKMASALQKKIEAAKYKLFEGMNNGAWCLARKYKIRLRGVDAPEIDQQYGKEARDLLRSLVNEQQLMIRVYNTDNYGRKVGDIYCNGIFIQEVLLKKGLVWHYNHFDERKNFAKWEMAAKKACLGLWANPNPKAPWDYRQMCGNRGSFKGRGA